MAHDVLWKAADLDAESVVSLAARLVRCASRGGVDSYEPVLAVLRNFLTSRGLQVTNLIGPDEACVGLVSRVRGGRPGPTWVLDACLDTAPFGDEAAWSFPPLAGEVVDGWLRGRGSADSKLGAAVFAHLLNRLSERAADLAGSVALVCDVDEHTGAFGGAISAFTGPLAVDDVAGAMIGYPGQDAIVVGGRGVLRARVRVHGIAAHSGSRHDSPNAIVKASALVGKLAKFSPPAENFPVPSKVTVTQINAGDGFSIVPDAADVAVDMRLTESFDALAAETWLTEVCRQVDEAWPQTTATGIEIMTRWPAFRLDASHPMVAALLDGAARAGLKPEPKVAGPSNIANYLAQLGVPALAGFGAVYEGLHAADERVLLSSVPAVHVAYHHALLRLLGAEG
jgi:succinyl-diaminopimelate desuccinylase